MTTPDYLWPARPEYLRIGTRVEPEPCASSEETGGAGVGRVGGG